MTIVAGAYMAFTPPFEGPDAGAHYRYAVHLRAHPGRPPLDAATAHISHELILQPPLYYALTALALLPFDVDVAGVARLDPHNPHYPGLSHRATYTPPDAPARAFVPARLAAVVSLIGGLLAAAATWAWVRCMLPDRPAAALAVATVVGLNPQFLFSSATITNDAWAAATCAATLWAGAVAARRGGSWRWVLAGAAAGLAALTKYTGLVVLAPLGLTWLWSAWREQRDPPASRAPGAWRAAGWAAVGLAAGFTLVAGWWYAENLWRWGTLVPADLTRALMPENNRSQTAAWGTVLREAAWLTRSYTGVFGYGVVAPAAYFHVVDAMLGLAVIGLAVAPWRRRALADGWPAAPIAAVWFTLVLAGILDYMRSVTAASQGRLLFPAAPAIALLSVLGWSALAPAGRRSQIERAVPWLMLGLAAWQALTLARAYAIPLPVRGPVAPDRAVDARFDRVGTVVGADLPYGGSVASGGRLPVTLYLRGEGAMDPHPAVMFVHVTDAADRRLGSFDGVPAGGRHPTVQWEPGVVFADAVDLAISAVATDTLAILSVGFYDPEGGPRRAVLDAGGRSVGDRAVLGHVMVRATAPDPSASTEPPALAAWDNGIVLTRADVRADPRGRPQNLVVEWRTRAPVQRDLTTFVHLLDRSGRLVGQVDRPPKDGANPTDTWAPGYPVRDSYDLPAAEGWDRLIIGFYDAEGRRVPLETGADHHVVARRGGD